MAGLEPATIQGVVGVAFHHIAIVVRKQEEWEVFLLPTSTLPVGQDSNLYES